MGVLFFKVLFNLFLAKFIKYIVFNLFLEYYLKIKIKKKFTLKFVILIWKEMYVKNKVQISRMFQKILIY